MRSFLCIWIGILLLSGCKARKQPVRETEAPPAESVGVLHSPFYGTRWVLIDIVDFLVPDSIPADRIPWLQFTDSGSRVTGYDGCNQIGGHLLRSGDSLRFDQLFSTKKYCADVYLDIPFDWALNECTVARVQGSILSLFRDEELLMRFADLNPGSE